MQKLNEELLDRVRRFVSAWDLKIGDYVITASGPLGVRGERIMNDADIVVSDGAWERLLQTFQPVVEKGQVKIRVGDDIEIACAASFVNDPPGMPSAADQLESAEEIDGLAFVSLEVCRQLKLCLSRPKDMADIQTLNYLIDRQVAGSSPLT